VPKNYIDAESRIRDFYQKFKTNESNIAAVASELPVGRLIAGRNAEKLKAKQKPNDSQKYWRNRHFATGRAGGNRFVRKLTVCFQEAKYLI